MSTKKPNSRRNLDVALERLVGKSTFIEKRTVVANAIVSQMLPDGAVKGGSAIKIRLGNSTTRFTTDLDVARSSALRDFSERLAAELARGWEGFTGTLVAEQPPHPEGVPSQYVMQPYLVKLSYNSKPWVTVALEVGHNEIGDAVGCDYIVPADANEILVGLGFPALSAVPVMALQHQVAQKLHAVSVPGSQRAHDLIDLQIIAANSELDLALVRQTCLRLFECRQGHVWPPTVEAGIEWDSLYAEQAQGLPVLQDVEEAVKWCNGFIDSIEHAGLEANELAEKESVPEAGAGRIESARRRAAALNEQHRAVSQPGKGHGPEL